MRHRILIGCAVLLAAQAAVAATFIVPTDDELVAKAQAIAIGTVEGTYVEEADQNIETVAEIRIERAMKGAFRAGELVRVVEPGGVVQDRGVLVPGAARYRQGERVLLFLNNERGRWRTTDMTLGKFRFATSTAGARVLVRETEDVVGWDHAGRLHREKVRLEQGFLRFVEERVRGRRAATDYEVEATEVTLETSPAIGGNAIGTNQAPFPAETYVDWVSGQSPRWPNMGGGVIFYKRTDTNIPGAADGGVSVIQGGLAAWTNHCASAIFLNYGGQRATASANHDGVNVVEFNDPQGRISGSWSGSGTVGITFISFSGNHSFNGRTWLNITGADVVFQDGYSATNASFASAMTHELGHGIGWRHSNQDYVSGGACNPSTQECTSAAIMNSSVSANYGYTLQPWDQHAAESVYPGNTCGPTCTPASVSVQPTSRTINSGQSTTLSVTGSGTAPLSYQWYIGTSGNTSSPIGGATGSSITVSPASTTSYWVRVSNSCGAANSVTATVTVNPVAGVSRYTRGDYNGDGRADPTVFRPSTGQWIIHGVGTFVWGQSGDIPVPADYNGDRITDIAIFRPSDGMWHIRLPNYSAQWGTSGDIPVPGDYDANGIADLAVFRPSIGTWLLRYAAGFTASVTWGQAGDRPVQGDWDGDGFRNNIGIWRPSDGWWHIRVSGVSVQWGINGDIPVPADYDGNRLDDAAVFRPSSGSWFVRATGVSGQWGQNGDTPVPADYNGDGAADLAVFRPSTGQFLLRIPNTVITLGQSGDIAPIPQ